MDKIEDISSYISGMSTTIKDKCWWIDKIPDDVNTVIDYGCAQGDLAIMIDKLAPNRFRYIGVDCSEEMLALARHNFSFHSPASIVTLFYRELPDAIDHCDPSKTVLVLNSVIHEIFSYLSNAEYKVLLREMFSAGFRCIAIRDMSVPIIHMQNTQIEKVVDAIESSKYAPLWKEYLGCSGMDNLPIKITEFFLKYRYTSNWNREIKEIYLWPWLATLAIDGYMEMGRYAVTDEEKFSIPYIRQKIHSDFGIDWPYDTHKKVLMCRY